ncbi:hypothetical protein FRB99_001221 [Tulasnella sp. 403]|nr:hypothetical protein FRB99_001221 [Tulasnella sp. 403]
MAETDNSNLTPETATVQKQHENHESHESHVDHKEMPDEEPPWDDEADRGIHHPPMIEQKPVDNPDGQQAPPN